MRMLMIVALFMHMPSSYQFVVRLAVFPYDTSCCRNLNKHALRPRHAVDGAGRQADAAAAERAYGAPNSAEVLSVTSIASLP